MNRSPRRFLHVLAVTACLTGALAISSPSAPSLVAAGRGMPPASMTPMTVTATGDSATAAPRSRASSTVGVLYTSDTGCTATVVASSSRSVIATAAHCVYRNGGYQLDRAAFVPGYRDGHAPYGVWQVEAAWTPAAWQNGSGRLSTSEVAGSRFEDHDVAFLRLRPNDQGQRAEDVLGSQGIRFDSASSGRAVTVLGYPGIGKYDGKTLETCRGTTHDVRTTVGTNSVLDCDFTPGSSGGPWITGTATDRGYVTGVTSGASAGYYEIETPIVAEAHYGSEAESVYDAAVRGQL